jgi:dextranase
VIELLPAKAAFAVGDDVTVEARGISEPRTLVLWRLADEIGRATVSPAQPVASFGPLGPGGYGVEADDGAATALDVLRHPLERLRYGFVSDFWPGRPTAGVADNVRRLHLNAVQFYDWMYRHAQLLPPVDEFADALGRTVSLHSVEDLAAALRDAGSLPLGYAAVYAVGAEDVAGWHDEQLLHPDGTPWTLADFLWNVDPSSDRWLAHFVAQLAGAQARVGFAGFHLDQYGSPKQAVRRDGRVVDLAAAFCRLIERVRGALPEAVLIFNNVNDFPTWATTQAPQDATYIEPWAPHVGLPHLAALAAKAAALAPDRPVSLAAYLSAYEAGHPGALAALRLQLAAVFANRATCLLFGEDDAVLVDPYYVRHARLDDAGRAVAKEYLDFVVRYGDLLLDPAQVDVTRSHAGGINQEVAIEGAPVSADGIVGTLWSRVWDAGRRRVVSLIDLTAQEDVLWDAHHTPPVECRGVSIAFERSEGARYFFASPDGARTARPLSPRRERWHDVVDVPPFLSWALVWLETD